MISAFLFFYIFPLVIVTGERTFKECSFWVSENPERSFSKKKKKKIPRDLIKPMKLAKARKLWASGPTANFLLNTPRLPYTIYKVIKEAFHAFSELYNSGDKAGTINSNKTQFPLCLFLTTNASLAGPCPVTISTLSCTFVIIVQNFDSLTKLFCIENELTMSFNWRN